MIQGNKTNSNTKLRFKISSSFYTLPLLILCLLAYFYLTPNDNVNLNQPNENQTDDEKFLTAENMEIAQDSLTNPVISVLNFNPIISLFSQDIEQVDPS